MENAGEVSGANPDGCAKEQPLKKLRAADIIRLECSERNERAFSGMKWSVKRANDCNEMKRYCGCISPTERRKWPCEDEERNSGKNIAAYFQAAVFFCAVKCLWNGGRRLFCRRPTGTAERNKGNDRRETAWLLVLLLTEMFYDILYPNPIDNFFNFC